MLRRGRWSLALPFLCLGNLCGDGTAMAFYDGAEYDIRCDAVPNSRLSEPIQVSSNQGDLQGRTMKGISSDEAIAVNLEAPLCPRQTWTLATSDRLTRRQLVDVMKRVSS